MHGAYSVLDHWCMVSFQEPALFTWTRVFPTWWSYPVSRSSYKTSLANARGLGFHVANDHFHGNFAWPGICYIWCIVCVWRVFLMICSCIGIAVVIVDPSILCIHWILNCWPKPKYSDSHSDVSLFCFTFRELCILESGLAGRCRPDMFGESLCRGRSGSVRCTRSLERAARRRFERGWVKRVVLSMMTSCH